MKSLKAVVVVLVVVVPTGLLPAVERYQPCPPYPCPEQPAIISDQALTPEGDTDGQMLAESAPLSDSSSQLDYSGSEDLLSLGFSGRSYATSSISPAGTGLGISAAMNDIAVPTPRATISPALLTSLNAESPYALDRIFFTFSFYNDFESLNTFVDVFPGDLDGDGNPSNDLATVSTERWRFDLNRFDFGLEKRLHRNVSVYFRAPVLNGCGNPGRLEIDGFDTFTQDVDGLGNLTAGIKAELFKNECTGDVFSAGVTIAAPTSDETLVVERVRAISENPETFEVDIERLDPLFFQPWLGFQINHQGTFVQGFFGVLIPDDDRVVTVFNPNVSVGCVLHENPCATVTSTTAVVTTQVLAPLDDDNALLNFSDQVFLTPSLHFGLCNRTSVFGGVAVPVAGPQAFEIGATCGFNYLY